MQNNSKELSCILDCLSNKINKQPNSSALKDLNWLELLKLSQSHQVTPIIYKELQHLIPKNILPVFKSVYIKTLSTNIRFWDEFRLLKDIFQNNDIKIVPLKGIIFADLLYKDIGLRPMVDIDILIQEKDITIAKQLMLNLNYQLNLKNLSELYWLKYNCHLCFYNQEKQITVELHWLFSAPRPYKIDISNIWKRTKNITIENSRVLTLSYEDMLMSVCLEICKNVSNLQFIALKNLFDIHLLLMQYENQLDYNYLIDKAKFWQIRNSIYYLYLQTSNFFQTPWPKELTHESTISRFSKLIMKRYASDLGFQNRLKSYFLMMLLCDTQKERTLLIFERIETYLQKSKIFLRRSLKTRNTNSGLPIK